jgi:hypothetical protein
MKKSETLEDLLKLVEDLPLDRYESPGATKKIEDLLELIEGLPLNHYAAPSAVQDVTRNLVREHGRHERDYRKMAADIVRSGMSVAGDEKNYNYGYGILLRLQDRDNLIKCLRHILYAKRGAPKKDEGDKVDKAFADMAAFDKVVERLESAGIKAPKTRAYEIFEAKWNLTNRQVRNRISYASKLVPF